MPADSSFSRSVKIEQKRPVFMLPVIGILIILIISSSPVIADETSTDKALPPDKAFLLFIANLDARENHSPEDHTLKNHTQENQWISPLDFADTDAGNSNYPPAATDKKSPITPDEESNHD